MAKSVESGAADKSNQLNDSQFRAFINLMAKADEACAKTNEARKRLRKEIKAAGVNLGDMDAVMRMMDWGRDEVRETFDRRTQYARWLKLPVGSQTEMFTDDTANSETGTEGQGDVVFSKAYQAGVKGADPKCPEEYLDHNQEWVKGYKAGQDSLAMDLIKKTKATTS